MPANATPIVTQVVLERLVDDLDELDMLAWAPSASEYDHARLRMLADEAMLLASTLLEAA